MPANAWNVRGTGSAFRRCAAVAALALASSACGGGSPADAAQSLASVAAGASLAGELRVRGALPAAYSRELFGQLQDEARKAADPLRKPGAGRSATGVLRDAARLQRVLGEMQTQVERDHLPSLRRSAAQARSLARFLSTAADRMQAAGG